MSERDWEADEIEAAINCIEIVRYKSDGSNYSILYEDAAREGWQAALAERKRLSRRSDALEATMVALCSERDAVIEVFAEASKSVEWPESVKPLVTALLEEDPDKQDAMMIGPEDPRFKAAVERVFARNQTLFKMLAESP